MQILLNQRLKTLRLNSPYTQKQLAEQLGISEVSYQRFEYGSSRPKLENIIALADLYNVSLDYLVGRTDNPEINE